MQVKLFVQSTGKGKPADRFGALESQINRWLNDHPNVTVEHTHRLSQPTFGWGQLALAVWYANPNSTGD